MIEAVRSRDGSSKLIKGAILCEKYVRGTEISDLDFGLEKYVTYKIYRFLISWLSSKLVSECFLIILSYLNLTPLYLTT